MVMFVYENEMGIMSDDITDWHGWAYKFGIIVGLWWDTLDGLFYGWMYVCVNWD